MLSSLEWQTLEEQHRIAQLTTFYKIHNNLVATLMPLQLREHTSPTRTEITLAYVIPVYGHFGPKTLWTRDISALCVWCPNVSHFSSSVSELTGPIRWQTKLPTHGQSSHGLDNSQTGQLADSKFLKIMELLYFICMYIKLNHTLTLTYRILAAYK